MKIKEIPICRNCKTMHISEGAIICPKCGTKNPKIEYRQFLSPKEKEEGGG